MLWFFYRSAQSSSFSNIIDNPYGHNPRDTYSFLQIHRRLQSMQVYYAIWLCPYLVIPEAQLTNRGDTFSLVSSQRCCHIFLLITVLTDRSGMSLLILVHSLMTEVQPSDQRGCLLFSLEPALLPCLPSNNCSYRPFWYVSSYSCALLHNFLCHFIKVFCRQACPTENFFSRFCYSTVAPRSLLDTPLQTGACSAV